jgi:hypothetical protein
MDESELAVMTGKKVAQIGCPGQPIGRSLSFRSALWLKDPGVANGCFNMSQAMC